MGFRRNRSVDDALQVTRRLVEEGTSSIDTGEIMLVRLFDIEKAYPRVSRDSLWRLMKLKGAPDVFMSVCQALHEHTEYQVRVYQGVSAMYRVDKGLREGCPSSPPLFNCYHAAVMADFRIRREAEATARGQTPGVVWTVKVDGRLGHGFHSRQHLTRKIQEKVIGDVGFADDTTLVGEAEEIRYAEPLLERTMKDWCEKVHPGKTEGLRLQGTKRKLTDVRYKGAREVVRHVGGMLREEGGASKDTAQKIARANMKVGQVAKTWSFGTRNQQHKMPHTLRIKVMKAVIMPTLTCFGRSRVWNREQIYQLQRVVNHAVRRCLGTRKLWMHSNHVNGDMLCEFAQWEPFEFTIARQSLFWLGHVARMGCERLPKQALFGWWKGHNIKQHPHMRQQQWFQYLLAQIQVTELDWFRIAMDREEWKKVVLTAFPVTKSDRQHEVRLNAWEPGLGPPPGCVGRFQREKRKRARVMVKNAQTNQFDCPLCGQGFAKSNSLVAHYVEHHAVADPDRMTVDVYGCEACGQYWRNEKRRRTHVCPANPVAPRPPRRFRQGMCSLCGESMSLSNLPRHEAQPANRTCERCGSVLGSIQARKNHEARCNA